jgi:hypothetical protein
MTPPWAQTTSGASIFLRMASKSRDSTLTTAPEALMALAMAAAAAAAAAPFDMAVSFLFACMR